MQAIAAGIDVDGWKRQHLPMPALCRTATPADLAALRALDTAVPTESGRGRQIDAWIGAGAAHLIENDGVIAGYGAISHDFFHAGMIEMVMIGAAFRRQGLGAALVRHLAASCRSETLWSSTNLSNGGMQQLLEAAGFIRSGVIEGLDEGDPEVIYRKRLR